MPSEIYATVTRLTNHSAVRFLVVGGLSFVVDAGSLIVFHGHLGIWLPLATAMAFGVAFVVNFGLNRFWAFGSGGAVGRQLSRYLYLVIANLAVTVVMVAGLTSTGIPYIWSKVITTILVGIANYVVSRRWIFI